MARMIPPPDRIERPNAVDTTERSSMHRSSPSPPRSLCPPLSDGATTSGLPTPFTFLRASTFRRWPGGPASPTLHAALALCVSCLVAGGVIIHAHDLERTQVWLTFARDGGFVVEVKNDPRWLAERLASIPGPFADRIVLWVDGREV